MYNPKDIQFVGKHDFDREVAERYASISHFDTFSINIFKWGLKSNGKEMKPLKCAVRLRGKCSDKERMFAEAERIVAALDMGRWSGKKSVTLKETP
jgi:hypothetical protein